MNFDPSDYEKMKLSLFLAILHLTWTAQAYATRELVHLPRDRIPAHLLARHISGVSIDIGQTLLARGLAPIKTHTTSTSELIARDNLQPLIVKRAPPRRQSPFANQANQGVPKGQGLMDRISRSNALPTAISGMMAAGTMIGIGSTTNWHDPQSALGSTVGMACVGAAAATAACAFRHRERQRENSAGRGRSVSPLRTTRNRGGRPAPSTELQTVPPVQSKSQAPKNSAPPDPSDLVRRLVPN